MLSRNGSHKITIYVHEPGRTVPLLKKGSVKVVTQKWRQIQNLLDDGVAPHVDLQSHTCVFDSYCFFVPRRKRMYLKGERNFVVWGELNEIQKYHEIPTRRKILKAICLVFWNYLFTVGKRRIYFGGYFVQTPNFTHLTIHKKSINLLELTLPNPFVVPPSHTSTSMWCVHNIVCTNASTAIRKMWSISRGNRKPSLNNTWVKWRFPLLGYYSRKLLQINDFGMTQEKHFLTLIWKINILLVMIWKNKTKIS